MNEYEPMFCDDVDCRVRTFDRGSTPGWTGKCPACQNTGQKVPNLYGTEKSK